MGERVFVDVAGIRFPYELRFNETKRHFRESICEEPVSPASECIKLDAEFLKEKIRLYPSYPPHEIEFSFLVWDTGNELLRRGICLFHGVAFILKGKAFILTGRSGVGKSTQYMNWKKLYPDEIDIINGDKHILKPSGDGRVFVSSSPWYGKEGFHSNSAAELCGIVCLKQQKGKNTFKKITVPLSIQELYRQILYVPYSGCEIHRACLFLEKLIDRSMIWQYSNCGDMASTEQLRASLLREMDKNY